MKFKLPEDIASEQDLKAVIFEIRHYASWLSHSSIKGRFSKSEANEQPILSETATALVKALGTENQPLSQKTLDELIASLEEAVTSLPNITITLAAIPTQGIKNTLTTWCRKNIDPNILVNFRFNSNLLGGMVVSYASHIYDWSFRRQILAGREHFPEVLRHV